MLFIELDESLSALENPGALDRYEQTLEACRNPDKAARETCMHTDNQVRRLRNMLEAIRGTAHDTVVSGHFELRMVTQDETQTGAPESIGSGHPSFLSDIHPSQTGGESTPVPYMTPTKIRTEPNSAMSLCNEEEQAGNTDEDRPKISTPGLRSSSNPSETQKQDPRAKLRSALSTRAIESTRAQPRPGRDTKVERQNIKASLRSASGSKPTGDDTVLAGLLRDTKLKDT